MSKGPAGKGASGGGSARKPHPPWPLRPYNSFNIFFTLERVRLIEARRAESGAPGTRSSPPPPPQAAGGSSSSGRVGAPTGYEGLDLPPPPPRYAHLVRVLPANWYVPGKHKHGKRKHSKSHGLASFKEIATIVAENWKSVDPTTRAYCEDVARVQKDRYEAMKKEERRREGGAYVPSPAMARTQDHRRKSSSREREERDLLRVSEHSTEGTFPIPPAPAPPPPPPAAAAYHYPPPPPAYRPGGYGHVDVHRAPHVPSAPTADRRAGTVGPTNGSAHGPRSGFSDWCRVGPSMPRGGLEGPTYPPYPPDRASAYVHERRSEGLYYGEGPYGEGLYGEADVSDEDILDAYHSAD